MPSTLEHPRTAAYWLGYGACALAGCFWGTGFYFGKVVLAHMGVGHMVFYRFVFACIGLLPFALRHRPQLNGREWRLLLIASFFGIPVQYLVQFYGLSLTTVSHASLMVGSMPVLLGAAATLFAGQRNCHHLLIRLDKLEPILKGGLRCAFQNRGDSLNLTRKSNTTRTLLQRQRDFPQQT